MRLCQHTAVSLKLSVLAAPLCRKSHFRSLETPVIQLHHDAGKSSCLQGLCSVHIADEERDAVCSAARSLDPYGISRIKMQSFRSQIHKMARTAGNTGKGMTEKQHKSPTANRRTELLHCQSEASMEGQSTEFGQSVQGSWL